MKKSSPLQNKISQTLLFALLGIVFIAGIAQLFVLRFEKGDIYPAYSSFRADPLGTKALYASFENIGPVTVKRNYHVFKKLKASKDNAVLYLGAKAHSAFLSEQDAKQLDRFVREGGRMIISFKGAGLYKRPFLKKTDKDDLNEDTESEQTDKTREDNADDQDTCQKDPKDTPVYLTDLWGFSLEEDDEQEQDDLAASPCSANVPQAAPSIDWHSSLYFSNLDDNWTALYQTGEYPVIMERKIGKGSVFMAADSFFLSNEALASNRHTDLLVTMAGGCRTMIFDESHLGIRAQSGIAGLMGKYRLQGLLIGTIAFMLVFVWKNAFYFMPATREEPLHQTDQSLSDTDCFSGLTNLLQKNISIKQILPLCVTQWQNTRSLTQTSTFNDGKLMEQIKTAAKNKKNPVKGYNTICEILAEKKTL